MGNEIELQDKVREKMRCIRLKDKAPVIDLAKACGYETEKGYYDLESGRIDIKIKHISCLMKYYHVSKEYFLGT